MPQNITPFKADWSPRAPFFLVPSSPKKIGLRPMMSAAAIVRFWLIFGWFCSVSEFWLVLVESLFCRCFGLILNCSCFGVGSDCVEM